LILEYILIGVIAFSIGHNSGHKKQCKHKKIVVVHKKNKYNKHKSYQRKFRKSQKRKGWHYHKDGTINMMCRNGWSF